MFSNKKLNNAEINNHNRMKYTNIYKFKILKQTHKSIQVRGITVLFQNKL